MDQRDIEFAEAVGGVQESGKGGGTTGRSTIFAMPSEGMSVG